MNNPTLEQAASLYQRGFELSCEKSCFEKREYEHYQHFIKVKLSHLEQELNNLYGRD